MARTPDERADRNPLYSLLAAEVVSQVGNMMTIVAGSWFVLQTTGSAAKVGILSAALLLGAALPAAAGGPLVDRMGYKRASVAGDFACAAIAASIPILYHADLLTFWVLILLVFLLSSVNSQGDTARLGLIPKLARRAGMSLERANAADRAVIRSGSLVGPLVAGVLVALIGAVNVFFIDALTFAISAALIAFGVPREPREEKRMEPAEKRSYAAELREGLRFVFSNKLLLSMVLIPMIGNSLDKPLVTVVAPVYAERVYGDPESLGVMVGAFGGGALAGTLLFGAIGRRLPRRLTYLSAFLFAPLIAFATLATTPVLGVVVIAVALSGVIAGPINPLWETVVQERTPPAMLGRTFGVLTALAYSLIPIGAVLVGIAIEEFGLVETIVGMGTIYLAMTIAMFFNPALHPMDVKAEA